MNKNRILISFATCLFLMLLENCFYNSTSKVEHTKSTLELDTVTILDFYQYSDFIQMKDKINVSNNLKYLSFWPPKNGNMENRPTDSLVHWFSNTSVEDLLIASDTFRFPNNCLRDTSIQSLSVICFNFHYGDCSFDMFERLSKLFFTSIDTLYLDTPIFLPEKIQSISLGYRIKNIPQTVLKAKTIKHLTLLDMDMYEFPEELKLMQQLETLNIELTGIGKRLKNDDSRALRQLKLFKTKMPNVKVIHN